MALLTSAARAQQSLNTLELFESSGEELMVWLAGTPMISLACRRVLDALESSGGGGSGHSANVAQSASSSSSSSGQLQMALSNLLTAQFHVIDGTSLASSEDKRKQADAVEHEKQEDNGRGQESSSSSLPLEFFVSHVFTGPELVHHIQGTTALDRMQEEVFFCLLARCLTEQQQQQQQQHAKSLSGRKSEFSPLSLLTNLTALFVQPRKGDGSCLASQEASKRAFSRAADALVAVLQTEKKKKLCRHSHSSIESLLSRVFGDGTVALKIQSTMELSKFCELYCRVLEIADTSTTTTTSAGGIGGAGRGSLRLLSALAFGSNGEGKEAFLPKLWRYLAVTVGLPLEISAVATKFEVPSLPLGVHSVPSVAQQPFLLFCRAMAHYLSTADDVEFYEEQGLFTLASQRAIVVGLSTLIFNTHLPRSNSSSSSCLEYDTLKNLLNHGPRLLRALFDRDTRRQFCPPALWLGPYSDLVRSGGADVSGAAVLRALLQVDRSNSVSQEEDEGEEEEDEEKDSIQQQRSRSLSSPSTSLSSSASGLAAVLLSAPQLIPFEERLEVFRGLVALDKQA
jgi:hypothetical protein